MAEGSSKLGVGSQIGLNILGGAAAATLDRRAPPEWTYTIGADATKPGSGFAIQPGAALAVGTTLLLMLIPGSGMGRTVVANLAGGMLVYEGVKVTEQKVIPMLEEYMAPTTPALPAGAPGGTHGLPYYRNAYSPYARVSDVDLSSGLRAYGMGY